MYFIFYINYIRSVFIYPRFLHFLYRHALHPCCDAGECLSRSQAACETPKCPLLVGGPEFFNILGRGCGWFCVHTSNLRVGGSPLPTSTVIEAGTVLGSGCTGVRG